MKLLKKNKKLQELFEVRAPITNTRQSTSQNCLRNIHMSKLFPNLIGSLVGNETERESKNYYVFVIYNLNVMEN